MLAVACSSYICQAFPEEMVAISTSKLNTSFWFITMNNHPQDWDLYNKMKPSGFPIILFLKKKQKPLFNHK